MPLFFYIRKQHKREELRIENLNQTKQMHIFIEGMSALKNNIEKNKTKE